MNTSKIRVLALLSLTAALSPVAVYARNPASFVIPFAFTAGPKTLDPGVYKVSEVRHQVLLISDARGRGKTLLNTNAGAAGSDPGKVILTFRKNGDHYFLARMNDADQGWEVSVTAAEKELSARRSAPASLYPVAAVRK